MKERTETIGATRLLWSLAIGLGLALALLWIVMPGTSAEAQPLTPGFPAAQAVEQRAPQSADAAQAVNPGFTLDLAYDTVWGMVNPGDLVTVTRTTGGPAYGAAEADGVGFFWTPLWQSNGQPADVVAGDAVEVYVNGTLAATLSPLGITGQVDVLGDQVTGNVAGLATGTSVTVTLGRFGQMVADVPQIATTVDGSGDFTADFSGVADVGPHEMAQVQYRDANGNTIQGYVYPLEVFGVTSWGNVRGYAQSGTSLTVTIFMTYPTDVVWEGQVTAQRPHGIYQSTDYGFGYGEVVEVDLGGGTVISVAVDYMDIRPDAAADQVTGQAPAGALVRGYVWDSVDGFYDDDTVTADGSDNYTLTFGADIETRHTLYVAYSDAEGDEVGYFAQPPYIHTRPWRNMMYAEADHPHQPVTYTLDTGSGTFTEHAWCGGTNNCDQVYFDSIAPGDVITVELPSLTMMMTVPSATLQADTANDGASGEVDIPGRTDVYVQQWNSYRYPIHGLAVVSTTSSPFAVTFTDYDVRDGIYLFAQHYDTNGHFTQIYRGQPQAYFEAQIPYGVGGVSPNADEPMTATLYATGGTPLASTSDDHDGDPWRFWFDDFQGYQLEPDRWITITSESGWEAGLQIPDLTVQVDQDSEMIWGDGPKSLLFVDHNGRNGWDGHFVPVDDYALDRAYFGDDIQWWDQIVTTYLAPNGNRARVQFQWPHVIAHYRMDGSNEVWGQNSIAGNTIYITVTDEFGGFVDAGTTYPGSGDQGPTSYRLDFPDGTIVPSNTVGVDFGSGFVYSTTVVSITAQANPDSDIVTVTAPISSWVNMNADDPYNNRWESNWSYGSLEVGASGYVTFDLSVDGFDIISGTYFNVHVEDTQYTFWLPAPELWVDKWTTPGVARPDGTYLYGIRYGNRGNGNAENTIITDTLPADTTYSADSSGFPVMDGGNVVTWTLGNVPRDTEGEFYVALNVGSGVPTQSNLGQNCIRIATTSPGDYDPGNNETCSGEAWADEGDAGVWVDKWPDPSDPHPGQEFAYDIEYGSNGSAATGPAWLTDTLPVSTTFVSWDEEWGWDALWTEVMTTGGQFVLYAPAGIPGDMGGRIRLTLLLDADVPISTTLRNSIVITTANDMHPHDNEEVDTEAHVSGPRYDMNANKWYNNGVLAPGGWIEYGVNWWNAGNTIIYAWMTDTLPSGTSYQSGSARDHNGQPFSPAIVAGDHVVWDLGLVNVSDGFGLNFTLDISDTVIPGTVLTNCATVGITETEDTPWDNTACVTLTVNANGPNLRVTKEHWWNGDGQLGYQIHFENIGDVTVSDVWITDSLPISTTWDGWWDMNFDWGRLVSDTQSSSVLRWQFSELYPGDSGWLRFNANLDEPGARFRWYTNTVEITTPPTDADPADNTDEDVAFSGGEVESVDLNVHDNNLWGCAYSPPVTITTAYTERVLGWECWDEWFEDPFEPGDVVTVAAGEGILPVVIEIPDPFTAYASSITDTVWGQIDALDHEPINVDLDDGPDMDVQTDGSGNYSATFSDIPRGGRGWVNYETEIAYAEVDFHRHFQAPDLVMTVDYEHDYVNGNYEPGHSVWITDTESDGSTIKATAVLSTGPIPWWGGQSGFETQWYDWAPSQPDIEPGDWVYGLVNSASYTTTVRVGAINGEVDVDNDTVSGTIDAPWLAPDLVTVNCEIHEENGQSIQVNNVDPDGGSFFCDFDGLYDIEPGHNVAVNYVEPGSNQVQTHPSNPAPYLQISKWSNDNPGEGGNLTFRIQYQNQGGDDAEDVLITDTMVGGINYITDTSPFTHTGAGTPADPLIWHVGTLPANSSDEFDVFVEITAVESDTITNTVQIATSDPYDQGDPGEKESWWSGHVWANDTHLNVGKDAWTGDPAPGTDFVFQVNPCNNGSTGSSQVTLTDTLHPSLTLQTWWTDVPGWTEVVSNSNLLVLSRPSIPSWDCPQIYLRVHLDAAAWSGMSISNTAVITASNDMEDDDNETTWWGNVGDPHTNLRTDKWWGNGQLVPGGQIRYHGRYDNTGNIPVMDVVLTDTLPVSTTFVHLLHYDHDWNLLDPVTPTLVPPNYVVWDIGTVENGDWGHYEIALQVDYDAVPGTVLTNTVEISPQPVEDDYDDNSDTVVETLYDHGPNLRVQKEGWWDDWGENTRRASYNLTVENIGDATVMPVVITDTYDSKMYLDGGVGSNYWRWWNWRDDPANHTFTVTLEVLYPGERMDVNFGTITDTEPLPFGLTFTNTAEMMHDPNDANLADNTDEVVLTTGPDLYVEKTLVDGDLLPGELITFSLAFGNDHEGHEWWWNMQGDARITDNLPDELEYVDSTLTPDLQVGSTLLWLLWPINAGEWNEIYLTVRITDTAEGDDVFTNLVEIESDQPSNDVEPDYGNNQDSYDVAIALPHFEVDKVYEGDVAGDVVTYTLTVTNVGNYPGTNVILSDTIPAYLEDVGSDGTIDFDWIWWNLGTIGPDGGTATAWFSATLPCTASLSIDNDDYGVYGSDQGVSGPAGDPVSFTVVEPTISVGITHTPGTIVVSDTVTFTATAGTDGAGLSYEWDLGDGPVSGGLTATQVYTQDGDYTVVFTATDTCGYSEVATATVTVNAPTLVADFDHSPDPANILVNGTVMFTDTSTTDVPPIVAWMWDFGDGSAPAFTQDASHIYDTTGTYTVTLMVTDTLGYSDDEIKTNVVTVSLACTPVTSVTFAYAPLYPTILSSVVFTATVAPSGATQPITYTWNFGDGVTSTVTMASTSHTYTVSGTMTVDVTAYNPCTPAGVSSAPADIDVASLQVFLPLVLRNY